jgi:hypothetical protein
MAGLENLDKKSAIVGMVIGGIVMFIIMFLYYYFTDDDDYVFQNNNIIKLNNRKNNNIIKLNNSKNTQIDVLSIKDDKLRAKIYLFVNAIVIIAKKNLSLLCKDKSNIINAIKNQMNVLKNRQTNNPKDFNKICNFSKSNFSIMNNTLQSNMNTIYESENSNPTERFSLFNQFNNGVSNDYTQLDDAYAGLMQYIVNRFFCKDGIVLLDKLENYLINVINSVCSKSDNTIDKLENGIQYAVQKPLSYL